MAYKYINEKVLKDTLVTFIDYLVREGGEDIRKDNHYFLNAERTVKRLKEEKYKEDFYDIAFGRIDELSDDPSNVGTGEYARLAVELVTDSRHNLVDRFQKKSFKETINGFETRYDQLFFDLFKTNKDELTFEKLVQIFGGRYDRIAFLFSLKGEPYLPISGWLEDGFNHLGIAIPIRGQCSWENYNDYCEAVREIHEYINEFFDESAQLIHAHSFLWIMSRNMDEVIQIGEPTNVQKIVTEDYAKKNKEAIEENLDEELNKSLQKTGKEGKAFKDEPVRKGQASRRNRCRVYLRDPQIAANALAFADYKCEYDNSHESFTKKSNGHRYTEAHHLIPMSYQDRFEVTLDKEANIVSLCSDCHNWIHYGEDAKKLLEKLFDDRRERLEKIGISITGEEFLKMYDLE